MKRLLGASADLVNLKGESESAAHRRSDGLLGCGGGVGGLQYQSWN